MSRKWIWTIVALAIVGATAVVGYKLSTGRKAGEVAEQKAEDVQLWTCGMHPEVILEEPGNCPKCGMKLVPLRKPPVGEESGQGVAGEGTPQKERKILYWRAPMDPTEIYDHPGKSKMGMDLIPVYEDEATLGAGGVITIDPVTVQNMGVRTAPVRRMNFSRRIRTVGNIDYDEERLFTVTTKISGWVEKLYVDFTGQFVRRGDPLLEIYSPEFVTAQQEYLLALRTNQMVASSDFGSIRDGARDLLRATRKRLLYWDIPESEILRLERTGEVRKTVRLDSPASGVVTEKKVVEGMYVREGMELYRIADLSRVWVYASIYDYELPFVRVGQEAAIQLSYLPEKTFRGRVIYIYPYLNRKARDVRIRMEFPNPDLELRPGMYANVVIQGLTIPDALVVSLEAVIRSGERSIVFVARGQGKFEPREVRLGEEGGPGNRYVRVLAGLLEGEEVVVSAQFLLDSESRLQEAIQKMLEERMKGSTGGKQGKAERK